MSEELKACPFCGVEPDTYTAIKTGEIIVYCHNENYKGASGIECPLCNRTFTVDEWNYRPGEKNENILP